MGLHEKELPDNYVKNVSKPENIKLAQKGVEESTVFAQELLDLKKASPSN